MPNLVGECEPIAVLNPVAIYRLIHVDSGEIACYESINLQFKQIRHRNDVNLQIEVYDLLNLQGRTTPTRVLTKEIVGLLPYLVIR